MSSIPDIDQSGSFLLLLTLCLINALLHLIHISHAITLQSKCITTSSLDYQSSQSNAINVVELPGQVSLGRK